MRLKSERPQVARQLRRRDEEIEAFLIQSLNRPAAACHGQHNKHLLGIKAHAHMLRHACGYKLANDGHDTRSLQAYLGHKNIQNTTRYTALAPDRFKNFWKD